MATRREVERRRNALIQDLREAVRSGSLRPGETLPPMKELAKKYNISVNVTHRAMQTLVEEGLLCTVSRVGTFVRRRPVPLEGFYLWIVQEDMPLAAQHGFEMRMAQLGATTLALRPGQIRELFHQGQLPSILGVFGDISSPENREIFSYFDQEALPNVTFASSSSGSLGDVVALTSLRGVEWRPTISFAWDIAKSPFWGHIPLRNCIRALNGLCCVKRDGAKL
ncbi:transcriptional regulator [Chthonomonas calidirosea]|uniref:GntR family transcriptional regulator n=1 Tax=Chthonomonas calidirosea TaxID=454171 RepID=UPI0006DD3DC6|nr:GntR family transcriptional regulator [Chthonomonas calidirosea]CEK13308.1 transcriptional regulator [Chthonomonas calidirosea]